ncbi:MAG: hypothetical protein ACM3N0_12620 [Chloroflexota bacterium]
MPRLVSFRPATACALALLLLFSATATAARPRAELRVIGKGGKVLHEGSFGLGGKASVRTSRKATCFGAGSGGSGKKATLKAATALGILMRGAQLTSALRPLLISDHFSFGLALCGVGGSVAKGTSSWYLKVNHRAPSVGGELVKLGGGDEVLWDLAPSYPYPDELALQAPDRVRAGRSFGVRVFAYDEKGKRTPAAGVTVTGASGPTDSSGRARVTLSRPARLIARHGGDIPSNREPVCVGGRCPRK